MFANPDNASAFAVNVNSEGVMNTIAAVQLRNRYPRFYEEYRRRCEAEPRELKPGDVFLWEARDGMWVFSLVTEQDPFLKLANKKAIEQAFTEMRKQAEAHNITSIAMPPVGAGVGGLNWGRARRTLERVFKGWKGTLFVYVKQPARQPN
jgi:O-acetyl-ADP-ribose deacetylase (regulator of RNase III)